MATIKSNPYQRISRTKIVATVGPACESAERIDALMAAGVDVFRLNMAHGGPEQQEPRLETIRDVSQRRDQPVAVLADLAGPKIRLGEIPGDRLVLEAGQLVRLVRGRRTARASRRSEPLDGVANVASPRPAADASPDDSRKSVPALSTTYPALLDDLAVGNRILLADGTVGLVVERLAPGEALCRVVQPGVVRSRQGLNLPGARLRAAALGPADRRNAVWAARAGLDFVGLSFVRSVADIENLKSLLRRHGSPAQVVAKIEKPEALDQLEAIVDAADAVMVARGDLGVEIDIAGIAVVQKRIVAECHRRRKPVIIATQMLDSMQHSRLPTRAEATDVANAVLDGADACMLSGETAVGEYPVEAVEMMHRIAVATEGAMRYSAVTPIEPLASPLDSITEATVSAAGRLADALEAKLVVVATASGRTALALAKRRNRAFSVGVSDSPETLRRMCLYWGVVPLAGAPLEDSAALLAHVARRARAAGFLRQGDRVVLIAGTGLRTTRHNQIVVDEIA